MQLERHWVWRRVDCFKDKCVLSVRSYREKLFRVRGFSEEGKWNPKCRCRCVYKVQNNDIVKCAFIEGNMQQCYGILPENFDVIKTFTVSYTCGQAFSVLSCRKSKFCFRFSDEHLQVTLLISPSKCQSRYTFWNKPGTQTQKFH